MGWAWAALGVLGSGAAWATVRRGVSIWRVMPLFYGALGAVALVAGHPRLSGDPRLSGLAASGRWTTPAAAAALGLLAGVGLFAATRAFVALAARGEGFARAVHAQYARKTELPAWGVVAASLVAAAGEELFWRGLVQPAFGQMGGGGQGPALAAAALAWLGYLLANLPSRSLPIVAGALVGGAVWAALPLVTGGIAASLACHGVWTTSMVVFPPKAGRGMMGP